MKKILFISLLLLITLFTNAYAGGGTAHMFIAKGAIDLLPDARLRNLLLDNLDAYLVGAYYPDSGFIKGTHHGEDSHYDSFIYAFAEYLKENYTDAAQQNPKLVAFLFGCAVHRVSDDVTHWTFYPIVADNDFKGDWFTAHSYGDNGIDLLLIMERPQQVSVPSEWWIPLQDLLAVYRRMGKPEYTAQEIIWGNSVISLVPNSEKVIAPGSYPILKWKMPWTAQHYYDCLTVGVAYYSIEN